jgi:hypothetical protein
VNDVEEAVVHLAHVVQEGGHTQRGALLRTQMQGLRQGIGQVGNPPGVARGALVVRRERVEQHLHGGAMEPGEPGTGA